MDTAEQIQRFQEFIELHYHSRILEAFTKGEHSLSLDFSLLARFDPDLAQDLLETPIEVIKAAEIAAEHFDNAQKSKFRIRFHALPESQNMKIREVRSKHIGKLLWIEGRVRQKSDVRPQVTNAKFECPSCGNIIPVLQLDKNFKEPNACGCGRKGKFRLVSKEMVDAQGIVLEEDADNLDGGEQPKRLNIFLQDDLVSPISDKKTNPGTKIRVGGVLKEVPIFQQGNKLTKFDLMLEANYVEGVEEDFTQVNISKEEEQQFLELSKRPDAYRVLVSSLAPNIYGHDKVKEALLLQMLGGVKKHSEKSSTRADLHILLIGDPGAGKSQLLKRVSAVAPKARFVSGKGASGAGLTAAVVKDEFLNGWSLEAGALVLANQGMCMIDELDKMSKDDTSAMHEALEQQTVTISKANIQATLRCETTVLAAANPKFGRFDPYEIPAKQIELPPSLINRFDLIFPIKDVPDKERDEVMASFILDMHKKALGNDAELDTQVLRKYIAYAKQNCHPKLSEDAIEEIKEYYVKMRNSGSGDGGVKAVPISARQLEALVRLAEAAAKSRLSPVVEKEDAKKAIELVHHCLASIGVDPETGQIDIDRISSKITASQRGKIFMIKEIITELEHQVGKTIPIDDIERVAKERNIDENTVNEALEKLKRSGDIFEPKRGFISKVG
jgi:replicative DNA helicase Mcm